MPNGFTEPEHRTESLTQVRTRDLKTGRFVGAPTLVAKNKWLDRLSTGVGMSSDASTVRRKKKALKKVKLDPNLSVTLKKKD
jgi:hypothetical protein